MLTFISASRCDVPDDIVGYDMMVDSLEFGEIAQISCAGENQWLATMQNTYNITCTLINNSTAEWINIVNVPGCIGKYNDIMFDIQ